MTVFRAENSLPKLIHILNSPHAGKIRLPWHDHKYIGTACPYCKKKDWDYQQVFHYGWSVDEITGLKFPYGTAYSWFAVCQTCGNQVHADWR